MKGVVWGSTFERAVQKLEYIERRYQSLFISIEKKIKSKNEYLIIFENGDIWKAATTFTSSRQRCNISYIDTQIDTLFVEQVIKPATSFPPYNAIQYYNI